MAKNDEELVGGRILAPGQGRDAFGSPVSGMNEQAYIRSQNLKNAYLTNQAGVEKTLTKAVGQKNDWWVAEWQRALMQSTGRLKRDPLTGRNTTTAVYNNFGLDVFNAASSGGSFLGMNNIVDMLSFYNYSKDIQSSTGWTQANTYGLGLSNLQDTHMDSYRMDDNYLRTQTKYLMDSSNQLRQYATQNPDGSYNISIKAGDNLGGLFSNYQRVGSYEVEVPRSGGFSDYYTEYVIRDVGAANSINLENVKLFTDYNDAYRHAQENAFLAQAKRGATQAFLQLDFDERGSGIPVGTMNAVKNNMITELNYAETSNLNARMRENEEYRRSKEVRADMRSGSGLRGSMMAAGLKLQTPNILGAEDEE